MRYHKDVGFPDSYTDYVISFFRNFENVSLTIHSISEMADDKNTIIHMPVRADFTDVGAEVIELYVEDDCVEKMLIRTTSMSDKYDYSFVLSNDGALVSSWSNNKDDHHTLERSENVYFSKKSQQYRAFPQCLEF